MKSERFWGLTLTRRRSACREPWKSYGTFLRNAAWIQRRQPIGETISANSVQAAPAALAKMVTTVAVAKGATVSTSTLTLIKGALKIMAWTKMKTAVVVGVAAILATCTTTIVVKEMFFPADQGRLLPAQLSAFSKPAARLVHAPDHAFYLADGWFRLFGGNQQSDRRTRHVVHGPQPFFCAAYHQSLRGRSAPCRASSRLAEGRF